MEHPPTDDPGQFAVRYYHSEAPLSIEPPLGWQVHELRRPSALAEFVAPEGAATIALGAAQLTHGQSAKAANSAFLVGWLGAHKIQIDSDAAFRLANGQQGWRRAGRESDGTDARRWALLTLADDHRSYHLHIVAPDAAFAEHAAAFERTAQSLQLEPTQPIEVPREAALVLASAEPATLDPALTHFGPSGLIGDLFSGLVVLDPHLTVRPALAERWEVSADGTVFTFHLNPTARFHNGRPVVAEDVLFSWRRAAHPDTGSNTVLLYLGDIVGLRAYHAGEAESIAGVRVLDDLTLQVTIDGPKAYFLAKLTYPVAWVVDRDNVHMPNWAQHPNGTGPFRVRQHLVDAIFVVERNPWYYGPRPRLDYVVYLMYAGHAPRLYEKNEVDVSWLTFDQLERARDPADGLYGNVIAETGLCTSYVTFNTRLPPFDDPLVRRAFAHAVDRERYREAIDANRSVVGRGVLPPGMPGYTDAVLPPSYDPALAREILARSTYGAAEALPPVVWTLGSADGRISSAAALLADMWFETLGVTITFEGVDWQDYFDRVDAGEYGHLLLETWCADYPDPENFLDLLFHSRSPQNHARYSDPAFDVLVEQARTTRDLALRLALYQEAEQRLLEAAPAIFLTHSGPAYTVFKPYVRGYVPGPIGVPQHHSIWLQRE